MGIQFWLEAVQPGFCFNPFQSLVFNCSIFELGDFFLQVFPEDEVRGDNHACDYTHDRAEDENIRSYGECSIEDECGCGDSEEYSGNDDDCEQGIKQKPGQSVYEFDCEIENDRAEKRTGRGEDKRPKINRGPVLQAGIKQVYGSDEEKKHEDKECYSLIMA